MASTILIKFSGIIEYSKPNNMTLSAFPGRISETRKIVCPSPNVAPKPTGQSHSHSISGVPLQISPALFLNFRPTLKIKGTGSLHKKQANKLSDKFGVLHT